MLWLLWLCWVTTMAVDVSSGYSLDLSSDGPAVLDAPIRFSGVLSPTSEDGDGNDGNDDEKMDDTKLSWRWNDDTPFGNFKEVKTSNRSMTYQLVYGSENYESRTYEMTLVVFQEDLIFFWKEIARKTIPFKITTQLNGHLQVVTPYKNNLVDTKAKTEIRTELYDPHGYLEKADIKYFWFINDTNFGQTNNNSFFETFKLPGETFVEVTVMAYLESDVKRDAPLVTNSSNQALIQSIPKKITNKFGVFKTKLTAENAITNMSVTGDLWLKHGDLLDLGVSCDGSGPWNFCWSVKKAGYNLTGNETCFDPQIVQTSCQFRVVWYFRSAGLSNVLLVVENGISKKVKLMGINVYDIQPLTPLSFVVVPIVSALAAVVAVMVGVIIMITFKRRLAVEVADFDFSNQDEQLEYKTFWERLRDSMMNAFGNNSDDVSHISSSSSNGTGNSVRPPVGIHYGSIT